VVSQRTIRKRGRTPGRLIVSCLVLLPAVYGAIWAYSLAVAMIGPFALLGALALVGLAGVALLPVLLSFYRRALHPSVTTTIGRLRRWVSGIRLVRTIAARFPRAAHFLDARLAQGSATGLRLTLGLLMLGLIAVLFGTLLVEVAGGDEIDMLDRRIINLAATLRTSMLDQVMLAITFWGNISTVVAITAIGCLVAFLMRRRGAAMLLVLSLAGSSLFFSTVKTLVSRPRPVLESARLVQAGFSFPSGHATVSAAFYGTLAYLLLRPLRRSILRGVLAMWAAALALLVGISRVYLGVHYPSDVVAGWIAGALWIGIIMVLDSLSSSRKDVRLSARRRAILSLMAVGIGLIAFPYVYGIYRRTPPPQPVVVAPQLRVVAVLEVREVLAQVPPTSETIFGSPDVPLQLAFVGTEAGITEALTRAGWSALLYAAPHSFLETQPNRLAFVHPADAQQGALALRLWPLPFRLDDERRIWLAGASLDQGVESGPLLLPRRQITPADAAAVVETLEPVEVVATIETLEIRRPHVPAEDEGEEPAAPATSAQITLIWVGQPAAGADLLRDYVAGEYTRSPDASPVRRIRATSR
jgi:membrane-associated phospholipid phosphatase